MVMFAPTYIADQFGQGFPGCTEVDHLLALRGVVLKWLGLAKEGSHWYRDLSNAANEMSRRLRLIGVFDPNQAKRPPRELFHFYEYEAPKIWDWLGHLAPQI